jgi:hypothetical protein
VGTAFFHKSATEHVVDADDTAAETGQFQSQRPAKVTIHPEDQDSHTFQNAAICRWHPFRTGLEADGERIKVTNFRSTFALDNQLPLSRPAESGLSAGAEVDVPAEFDGWTIPTRACGVMTCG